MDTTLEKALKAAEQGFKERHPRSLELHESAVSSLPGGNTRTLLHTSPFPIYLKKGDGYKVFDEDEHEYTDFVGELTAGLYGHSHPIIQETLISTIQSTGLNLGGTTQQESEYASLLCSRFNLDRVRFCNSGTEANLHALAAARRFTGRNKVVVFKGGYHGAVLSFGHGVAPNNVDKSDWILAKYNDAQSTCDAIAQDGVAAVLVEGMQGSGGCIPGTEEFLHAIQKAAKEANALFILDEVMTSRLSPSGLQFTLNLSPDLTTLGKYLGGGLAFGAFGGRADIMAVYDPRNTNSLTHSGTFNNNTLAMHAGYAGLNRILTPEVCIEFNKMGDTFREKLNRATSGTRLEWTGVGSLLCLHCTRDGSREEQEDEKVKELFWMEMLRQGFWITKRGMIALILGTPEAELERFVGCVRGFVEKYMEVVRCAMVF